MSTAQHASMPDLTLLRRPQTALGASSAARAIAEGAFAASRDEAEPAVVVIKRRRRAIDIVDAAPDGAPSAAANSAREQRVFRVAPSLPIGEPSATTSTVDVAAADCAFAEPVAGSLDGVSPVPRRQRRRKNGEVTIIRPERVDEHEVNGADSHGSLAETPQFATLPLNFDFLTTRQRYEQLRSQIAKLEREAQKLRAQEAAHAVRWIRRAIEDYGLTAEDLGFS